MSICASHATSTDQIVDILSVLRLKRDRARVRRCSSGTGRPSRDSPEPLGDGSVLPGGLGQLLLNPESLLGRL
jgi:hypothetical protein